MHLSRINSPSILGIVKTGEEVKTCFNLYFDASLLQQIQSFPLMQREALAEKKIFL